VDRVPASTHGGAHSADRGPAGTRTPFPAGTFLPVITRRRGPGPALRRLRIALLPLPGQALGLVVLVAVLAAALVSVPLMVSSAEQGAWEQQERRLTSTALGTTLLSSTFAHGLSPAERLTLVDDLDAAVSTTAGAAGLGTPLFASRLWDPGLTPTPAGPELTEILFRTGAADHVDIVAGRASDSGVLVPEGLAAAAGVAPGDTLTVQGEDGRTVPLPVSGVYATPPEPLEPYWRSQAYLLVPRYDPDVGEIVFPPHAVLAPREIALPAYAALDEDLYLEWFLPLDGPIRVAGARAAARSVEELRLRMTTPDSPVAQVVEAGDFETVVTRTVLPEVLTSVERTVEVLTPPVRAVGIGGGAAALVLVGAWAGLRVRRRDDELRSLVARGLSPGRAAGDAAREAVLPVLVGLGAGGLVGWLLIRSLGPSPYLPPTVAEPAAAILIAGALTALAVIAGGTAALVSRFDSIGRGQLASAVGRVPWLAVTAAATVLTAVPLGTGGAAGGSQVGILTLLVPLLVTVTAAGIVTAALPRLGRRTDARLRRLPPVAFLAARRVLAGQGATRLVVVTTALALGLVVYAGALADSTDRTIAAKASVATGSDVVIELPRTTTVDGRLPPGAMVVGAEERATLVPSDAPVDVLIVRPEQVPDVVRWNDAFADRPLADLMDELAAYDGDRVPVVVAGPLPDGLVEAAADDLAVDFRYYSVPVEIVARAAAFPGQGSRDPMLIADWNHYTAAVESAGRDPGLVLGRELWARGEVGDVLDSLAPAGVAAPQPEEVTTAADFAARPELHAQTWTLDYLRAIALAAALLGLVGVAMHALSQQRRRTAAGLLLARMGMSRRSADVAGGLEIGLLTGTAALVAIAVALPASALVLRLLDPVPDLQPDPLFAVPWTGIAVALGGVVLVTVGGAVLVGRAARRTTGGQVMRDAP
jgi:putative ABC transport system permease protein